MIARRNGQFCKEYEMDNDKKICIHCGAPDAKLRPDLTGRYFCSLDHFQQYYKEHNANDKVESHELLTATQILSIQEEDLSFTKEIENLNDEDKLKVITSRIEDVMRLQQRYKAVEFQLRKHTLSIRERQESEKTERYRKYGVNSDRELKEKHFGIIEKRVISYRKMNMSEENILSILKATTGKDEAMIKSIMEEVK